MLSLASARRLVATAFLLGWCRSAYALGDSVVPQAAGLIVGGPLAFGLFMGLLGVTNWTKKAEEAPSEGLVGLLMLGLGFNAVWLGLLLIFDPGTWGYEVVNLGRLAALYLLPVGGLAVLAGIRGRYRSVLALLVTCLVVWLGYASQDVW